MDDGPETKNKILTKFTIDYTADTRSDCNSLLPCLFYLVRPRYSKRHKSSQVKSSSL